MKRTFLAFPIALSLALVGCSSTGSGSPEPALSASPTRQSTASEPLETEFKVGDTVTFGRDPVGSATLLSMQINPPCKYPSYDPQSTDKRNGRPVHVALEMSVEAAPTGNFINMPSLSISERDKDGYLANTLAHSQDDSDCFDYSELLDTIDAGSKQRGWILLAAEASEGEFVWNLQRDGKKVVIPFSVSNPNTSTASAPATADLPVEVEPDYQELADKLTEIGQETTPIPASEAKQVAKMMCGVMELDPQQEGVVDRMIQDLVDNEGIPKDAAADMVNTMIEYECPAMAGS